MLFNKSLNFKGLRTIELFRQAFTGMAYKNQYDLYTNL